MGTEGWDMLVGQDWVDVLSGLKKFAARSWLLISKQQEASKQATEVIRSKEKGPGNCLLLIAKDEDCGLTVLV